MDKWNNKYTKQLCSALLNLKNEKEAMAFLRDLLTEPEIIEFGSRLEVAKQLASGKTQRQVSKDTKVSIATVTRVNQWLKRGMGGYSLIIERIDSKSPLVMGKRSK